MNRFSDFVLEYVIPILVVIVLAFGLWVLLYTASDSTPTVRNETSRQDLTHWNKDAKSINYQYCGEDLFNKGFVASFYDKDNSFAGCFAW